MSQGVELRHKNAEEAIEAAPEVKGQRILQTEPMRRLEHLHHIPSFAIGMVPNDMAYVRDGRRAPLAVCYPPHVVVSAARTFAIFDNEFLVVPPRQLGISGPKSDSKMLKALALYLNSDFAAYHQFLTSPQEGVHDGRGTLSALKKLPMPLENMDAAKLSLLSELHSNFVDASRSTASLDDEDVAPEDARRSRLKERFSALRHSLNEQVYSWLKLAPSEACLVDDFVGVKMHLSDGMFGEAAVRAPDQDDLSKYACTLRYELDGFLDRNPELRHRINVVFDDNSGMVEVAVTDLEHAGIQVGGAGRAESEAFARVREVVQRKANLWLYFDRNLIIHINERTYLFKPLQRLWWTRTQALLDADEIIAEHLAAEFDA